MSMWKSLLFVGLVSCLGLSSCAGMQQAWVDQNCNHEAAYSMGMNDARGGAPMSSQFGASCPPERRDAIYAGYREGYTAGLNSMQPVVAAPPPDSGALINVNIGGGGPQPGQMPYPRSWYCKLRAFTDDFEAYGSSQMEASHRVIDHCRAKYDPMFCKEAACRPYQ